MGWELVSRKNTPFNIRLTCSTLGAFSTTDPDFGLLACHIEPHTGFFLFGVRNFRVWEKIPSIPLIVNGLGWAYNQIVVTVCAPPIFRGKPRPKYPIFAGLCFYRKIPSLTVPMVLVRLLLLKGISDLFFDPGTKVPWEPVDKIEGNQIRIPKFLGNLFRCPPSYVIPTAAIDPTEKRLGSFQPYCCMIHCWCCFYRTIFHRFFLPSNRFQYFIPHWSLLKNSLSGKNKPVLELTGGSWIDFW